MPPILFRHFPQKTNLSVTICKWSNIHCLICWGHDHYLTKCPQIKSQTKVELQSWIIRCNRCWRCSRTSYSSVNCTLKKPCPDWSELHFQDWYAVDKQEPQPELWSLRKISVSHLRTTNHVILKVVLVLLQNTNISLSTCSILDDGSVQSMILPADVKQLQLSRQKQKLTLHTIHSDLIHKEGKSVQLEIALISAPTLRWHLMFINGKYPPSVCMKSLLCKLQEDSREQFLCWQLSDKLPKNTRNKVLSC